MDKNKREEINFSKDIIPYLVYSLVALLFLSTLSTYQDFYPLTVLGALSILMFFLGLFIRKIGTESSYFSRIINFQPLLICFGWIISGSGLWLAIRNVNFDSLASRTSEVISAPKITGLGHDLSIVIFLTFGFLSVSVLALYGFDSQSEIISGVSKWIMGSRIKIAFSVGFIGIYLAFIRPQILTESEYLPLGDWGLVALFTWMFFRGIRKKIEREFIAPPEPSSWEKHSQEKEFRTDGELVELEESQKLFVEKGIKENLVVNLAEVVQGSSIPDDSLPRILSPIINYQDEPVPSLSFGWMRKIIKKKNREERKKLLDETMEVIENLDEDSE